jgi:hypothetical protein
VGCGPSSNVRYNIFSEVSILQQYDENIFLSSQGVFTKYLIMKQEAIYKFQETRIKIQGLRFKK